MWNLWWEKLQCCRFFPSTSLSAILIPCYQFSIHSQLRSMRLGKVRPRTGHEVLKGVQMYCSTISLTSALDGSTSLTPRPGRFTTGIEGAGNLDATGIRSPDLQARSNSP